MLALEVNGTVLMLVKLASHRWAIMLGETHLANVTMTGNPQWHTDAEGYHALRTHERDQLVCAVRTPDDIRVIGHTTRDFTALIHTARGLTTMPYSYHMPSKRYENYAWGGYCGLDKAPLFDVYEVDASDLSSETLCHLRDALVMCAMDRQILQS